MNLARGVRLYKKKMQPRALVLYRQKKAPKALNGMKTLEQKHKNANKRISDYFPLRCI